MRFFYPYGNDNNMSVRTNCVHTLPDISQQQRVHGRAPPAARAAARARAHDRTPSDAADRPRLSTLLAATSYPSLL